MLPPKFCCQSVFPSIDREGLPVLEGMVGHYRVEGKIGAGGMGVVYKAFDAELNRPVAIKALSERHAITPEAIARLRAEALSAASLDHPYICKIYELVDAGAGTLIVMEFVDGETLEAKLRRGPLSIAETLRLGREIAEGLANAHARGLVHRDIKPSNVMVTTHGHVKLLDFGLARPDTFLGPDATTRAGTDQTGRAGTPSYMAPEQALGKPITARVDVFAFGVLLFACLTGELPFDGMGTTAYLEGVVSSPAKPIVRLAPAVPADLVKLISLCLAKDPVERPASAAVLAAELRRLEEVEATREVAGAAAASRQSARRWIAIIGTSAALVIVVAVVAIARWVSTPRPHEVERHRQVVPWPSDESGSRLSQDGRFVSFISNRDGMPTLFVQPVAGGEPRSLGACTGTLLSHVWGPDNQQIACLVEIDGRVFAQVVSASGGGAPVKSIAITPRDEPTAADSQGQPWNARALRWIGGAIYLQFDDRPAPRALYRLNLDEGTLTNLTKTWTPAAFYEFDVRPDGTRVVFSVLTGSKDAERENLFVCDLDGGNRTQLTDDPSSKRAPLWVGAQDFVVYQSNRDGRSALWEVSTTSREAWPLASQAPAMPQSTSKDGSIISYRQDAENAHLLRFDERGKSWPITQDDWSDLSPSLSADGRVLAFQRNGSNTSSGSRFLDARLFVGVLDGATLPNEPRDYGPGFNPLVSPAGTWIAYAQTDAPSSTTWRLVVKNLKTAETLPLTDALKPQRFSSIPFDWWYRSVAWNAPGTELYFVDGRTDQRLRRLALGSTLPAPVLMQGRPADQIVDLFPSIDGRALAYLVNGRTETTIHVRDLTASQDTAIVLPGGSKPLYFLRGWTRDRSLIVVERGPSNPDGSTNVTAFDVTTAGRVRTLATLGHAFVGTTRLDVARSALYFTCAANRIHNVCALSLQTGSQRTLTDNQSLAVTYSGAAPVGDGTMIAPRDESTRDVWLVWLKRR